MRRPRPGPAGWALVLVVVVGALLAGTHVWSAAGPATASAVAETSTTHDPTCGEPSSTPVVTARTTTRCAGPELAAAAVLLGVAARVRPASPPTGTRPPVGPSAGRPRLTLLGVDRN